MEHKQFISDELDHCPYSNQGFQTDRFTKTTNNLNIPDTILENCSAELSGESLKMEASKIKTETWKSDDNKENICSNQQFINNSVNLTIDNSYIKRCERNLLESSYGDEKNSELDHKSTVNRHLLEIQGKSPFNDTISTPPSLLRREISMLRHEMVEAYEFHDLEMKVLRDERSLDVVDSAKYVELFEKYSSLVDLYTSLKTELDDCRKNQESVRNELQCKTADYLESLCSQIETSDNSLNFSSSFVSFGGGVKSSTMMELSEVETTVLHEGTVLAKDPLSITLDNDNLIFKTPTQTPLSAKKLFSRDASLSVGKMTGKAKDSTPKRDLTLDSDFHMQLLNLETALYDKVKEVEDLEQRLFKVEDMSLVLHNEFERISSVFMKDNKALMEEVSAKAEQLNELMQRLFTETISLNPSLKDSLIDTPGTKLLSVFIETIMENCKKIKDDDQLTTIEHLRKQLSSQETKLMELEQLRTTCEDWKAKLLGAKNTIATREEEIKMLQSHASNIKQTREDLEAAKEAITKLECKLRTIETEKNAAESRCRDLENVEETLTRKVTESQTELADAHERKYQIETENKRLKDEFDALKLHLIDSLQLPGSAMDLQCTDLTKAVESEREHLRQELKEASAQLEAKLKQIEAQKTAVENRCGDLEALVENLKREIDTIQNLEKELQTRLTIALETKSVTENENSRLKESFQTLQAKTENLVCEHAEEIRTLKSAHEIELQNLMVTCEDLKGKILEAENTISSQEKQIKTLQSDIERNQEETSSAKAALLELETEKRNRKMEEADQLLRANTEKLEAERRCRELEESLAALQAESNKKAGIIKDLEEAREKLEHEREVLVRDSKEALDELVTKLTAIEKEKTAAENRCRDLEGIIENMKRETDNKLNLEKDLQMQLSLALEMKSEIENESARWKESYETLQAKTEKLLSEHAEDIRSLKFAHENELQDLKVTCEDLKAKILEAEGTISAQESQIKTLQSDIERSREETSSARAALSKLEAEKQCQQFEEADQLSKANTEKLEAERHCRELEERLARLQDDGNTKMRIIKELEEAREKLEHEREVLVRDSKEAHDELVIKLKAIEEEKTAAENRCGDLEGVIENMKRENDNSQKDMQTRLSITLEMKSNTENENARLKESFQTLEAKFANLASEHAEEIRSLKSAHETEFQDLMGMCENLKAKLLEAESTISAQQKEIETLQSNFERSQEETSAARAALLELETEKHNREMEGAHQLSKTNTEKLEAERRCRELEERLARLQDDSNTKMRIIKELEGEKEKLEREREGLLLQKLSVDESILKLKSQLTAAENEKSEMEVRCNELQENNQNLQVEITSAKNLKNNPAYEKIQNENDGLKQTVFDYEKMVKDMKSELELAKENQRNNTFKVEELIREIEDLKRENTEFSHAFVAIEETQKNLADVLSEVGNDSDLPGDRVTKVIAKTSKPRDTRENKIVSDFVETVSKTCKGVQNELIKKFDSEKQEWETRRDVDLQNLRGQIELLAEKNDKQEAVLIRAKDDLARADDQIQKLKSELSSTQTEKDEAEYRCRELEQGAMNLKAEIDTKDTIIKGLDELKIAREKLESENGDLKRQVLESEEVVVRLKQHLKVAQEEQAEGKLKLKGLEGEIILLKKEKECLVGLTERMKDLERSHRSMVDVLVEVQSHLDLPEDTLAKFLSEESKNRKIFIERINIAIRAQMDGLKVENRNLKLGHESLKERVKQLTKIIEETAESEPKDLSNGNASYLNGMNLKIKSGKRMDRYARRLDKLEEINHNLMDLVIRILTTTEFPDVEKLNLSSVREFPKTMKMVLAHVDDLVSKMKELDEECETYSNIIKDLKKEAVAVWKSNTEKTEAMEAEIGRLQEEKNSLENEKQELLAKICGLDSKCQKLQSTPKTEGPQHDCNCGKDSKKINELKRIILMKEQKLLELQDLEGQTNSQKSQIEYLKTSLEREKKKVAEEKEKNKKLQNQINEMNEKPEKKKSEENQVLEELRMRGSISGGIVQEFGDKEKMKKLAKDIGILKELCRARYAEIKRLEAVNAALRNATPKQTATPKQPTTPKNSNQMDSPIHSRGYNTRSKHRVRDVWKSEIVGKENGGV